MSDFPDYTYPVDISAQSITTVAIDIKASSIGNIPVSIEAVGSGVVIAVDIAAQSVGNLTVDIAAASIGNLPIDIAAQSVGNLKIDIAAQSLGQVDVNIAASEVAIQITNETDAGGNPIPLKIDIAAQSVGNVAVDIAAQSVGNLTVDIAAASIGNLPIDIAAQSVGNLKIDIAAQSLGQVDVNIAASAVTLNVQVEGTANVNIANAEVYLNVQQERKGFAWVYIGENSASGSLAYYKYYYLILWHGARAFIRSLSIGVKNSDTANDKTLKVRFYVWHSTAPLYETTITVEAGFDGTKTIYPLIYWNYDMLIVEIENPDTSNVGIYYTSGTQTNYYAFSNTQFNYTISSDLHIQVELRIADAGSIPVSGTVNTIQIPNVATVSDSGIQTIPLGETVTLVDVEGIGRVHFIMLYTRDSTNKWTIYIDDVKVFEFDIESMYGNYGLDNAGFGMQVTKYDASGDYYAMIIEVPFEFKRNFKITVHNSFGSDNSAAARAFISLIS